MADVKTESVKAAESNAEKGSSGKGFIFGQNMEDRVIKPAESEGDTKCENGRKEDCKEDNDTSEAEVNMHKTGALPKPQFIYAPGSAAFGRAPPAGGILGASKLNNPFLPAATPTGVAGVNPVSHQDGGIIAASKLGPNPFAAKPSMAHPSISSTPNTSDSEDEKREKPILAPAHFTKTAPRIVVSQTKAEEAASLNASKSLLRPSPLAARAAQLKNTPDADKEKEEKETGEKTSGEKNGQKADASAPCDKSEEVSKRLFGDGASSSELKAGENYFAQFAGKTDRPADKQPDPSSAEGFIFGQNLSDRVANAPTSPPAGSASGFLFGQNLADRVVGADTTSPNKEEKKSTDQDNGSKSSTTLTLAESASAYQAKLVKPEYQEVEVKTGEENESNVIQINCKLYIFEKETQTWLERGRGLLRLNDKNDEDSSTFGSRLVMRTQGSLRVVLNSKIWEGMMVERPSTKSIRITATEGETVRVFLIMASLMDVDQMFQAIDWRVQQLKATKEKHKTDTLAAAPAPAAQSPPPAASPHGAKRSKEESPEQEQPAKKARSDPDLETRQVHTEESNDSSTVDPETEASCESITSSPTIKSSSSVSE